MAKSIVQSTNLFNKQIVEQPRKKMEAVQTDQERQELKAVTVIHHISIISKEIHVIISKTHKKQLMKLNIYS